MIINVPTYSYFNHYASQEDDVGDLCNSGVFSVDETVIFHDQISQGSINKNQCSSIWDEFQKEKNWRKAKSKNDISLHTFLKEHDFELFSDRFTPTQNYPFIFTCQALALVKDNSSAAIMLPETFNRLLKEAPKQNSLSGHTIHFGHIDAIVPPYLIDEDIDISNQVGSNVSAVIGFDGLGYAELPVISVKQFIP